jgi:hypothetical protein
MHEGMTVRGLVRNGRLQVDAELDLPDNTEVELSVILDQDDELDAHDRARLDAHLAASKSELANGAVMSFDEVIGEI